MVAFKFRVASTEAIVSTSNGDETSGLFETTTVAVSDVHESPHDSRDFVTSILTITVGSEVGSTRQGRLDGVDESKCKGNESSTRMTIFSGNKAEA